MLILHTVCIHLIKDKIVGINFNGKRDAGHLGGSTKTKAKIRTEVGAHACEGLVREEWKS